MVVLLKPDLSAGPVKVIHGPEDDVFENLVGASIAVVQVSLVNAFNIPADADAWVNGLPVGGEYRLCSNDVVEFVRRWGRKGGTSERDEYFFKSSDPQLKLNEILFRLNRLEELLRQVIKDQAPAKDFYSVEEFAKLVDLAPYTVREHCRLQRLRAEKAACGRGCVPEWRIPHSELVRYRSYGLLPLRKN